MRPIGTFSLVLHTHLPWVAHNGTWPVGEEWLHQAFTGSWRRVLAVLESLADHGYRDVLTLGVTPVVAAMLDDPYCLRELHSWTGRWRLRAEELAARAEHAELAAWEFRQAEHCLHDLERRWLTGGLSAVLRPLVDDGVVELLSGPATHPFQPLLADRFAAAQLRTGLADTRLRLGRPVTGIWAPECGYAPGMAEGYARLGIDHFVVDGPAVSGDTGLAHPVDGTDVLAFARDLPVSERIWSSRTGYPAGPAYRDFHTFDHASGFRPARVTGPGPDKRAWQPQAAAASVLRDARDFVGAVVERLTALAGGTGRPGLVVAAFDTELFGHWWYEGPQFLAAILRMLPAAGVRLATLRTAARAGLVGQPVELPPSSWGAGKDWRVWDNDLLAPLNAELTAVQKRLFTVLDGRKPDGARYPELDQLAREALLASSSDWAFMISRDSAAGYAWQRSRDHAARFFALADAIEGGSPPGLAVDLRRVDGPFGHLDARTF